MTPADILAKVEAISAKLDSGDNPLAVSSTRLLEAGDRPAELLDVARARHPELGLESVLELSGLSRGTHYSGEDTNYVLRLPGGRQYDIHAVAVGTLVDNRDPDGFANEIRELLGESTILLFPEYALAEVLSNHPELVAEAAKASTMLATPSTMLAMLGWVKAEWRHADNVGELAGVAGQMAEVFKKFAERYAEIGAKLEAANEAYDGGVDLWPDMERTAGLAVAASGGSLEKPRKVKRARKPRT